MTMRRRWMALCALVCCSVAAAEEPGVAALEQALERARRELLDVLAPDSFAAALAARQAASREEAKGRKAERVRAQLQAGEQALANAGKAAAGARQLYGGLIKAREDALAAQAPQRVPQAWLKASERFQQAMREHEHDDPRAAQRRAAEAEVLLRDAELLAIKAGILDEARASIAQAEAAKAGEAAPQGMAAARRYLDQAEREVQRNRYEVDVARRLAAQARSEARHAIYLAGLIGRALEQESDGRGGLEALILSWEEPLKRIGAESELALSFEEGLKAPLAELGEHARQQTQEVRRLKQELLDRDEQIAALNAQLERLQARLGGVAEERIALQRRVDAEERLRSSVAAVESSFTADEARVYRQGDDVVVSLLGIKFPSGRSTLDGGNAPLLDKVRRALELFAGAAISVEGHTDANGSDSANLILSQDRADAVKQHLVASFGLDPERIGSVGYGEARPIASNETAAGRARNRRIDLVIHAAGR